MIEMCNNIFAHEMALEEKKLGFRKPKKKIELAKNETWSFSKEKRYTHFKS
jgi:hypothetical protein